MPRSKAIKSKSHKSESSKPITTDISNRLANLLNTISNNRSTMTKSEINLPARLMQNGNKSYKPLEYSKSVSSTFTSSMHNGNLHSAGKEIINDSTKPFIQVAELHNGLVEHYMIPRNQSSLTRLIKPASLSKTVTKKNRKTKKTKKTKKTIKS
jgi:hypothetical protein